MDEEMIDQSQLANDLSSKIKYDMHKLFLVKPLEPVMVKKAFDEPVAKDNTAKKDENGIEAVDYDSVKTEIKEVESDFCRGVVLKVPFEYNQSVIGEKAWKEMPIEVGDVVVYMKRAAKWFDLLKDSHLISGYDIIAVER